MAHFERPQYKRISTGTLYMDLASNKELDVALVQKAETGHIGGQLGV
ncbi:hypothetical protein [Beijerinckia mobilis]|nr:hypothetical protein [Beijerinckia mobilis]